MADDHEHDEKGSSLTIVVEGADRPDRCPKCGSALDSRRGAVTSEAAVQQTAEPRPNGRRSTGDIGTLVESFVDLVVARIGTVAAVSTVEPWMTTEEAASYARMKPDTLRKHARAKRVRHGRDGAQYKFKASHIDEYLQRENDIDGGFDPDDIDPRVLQILGGEGDQ